MCGYVSYAQLTKYTNGVMSDCIPEHYLKKQNRSFIALWHVQDTEVVCIKKSPFHYLVQFVFICPREFNEVTQREFVIGSCPDKFSDTSANEDNSFRNHIRQPKSSLAENYFPQVSIENRLIRSGCCPLLKGKFYKIVKKHTIKGQKLTKGSDEQLPNSMKKNGNQNEKLTIFTLLY